MFTPHRSVYWPRVDSVRRTRRIGLMLGRLSLVLCATATLSGCGLAGTAGGAAVGASNELQQAQQAKQTEARVQQQIHDAQQQAAAQRDQAERDAQ